jgi:1-acyl-sn-glycerol-3-phosphate acyltransferase
LDPYEPIAALFRLGWRALALDVRSAGHGHIPAAGPAILASNHVGYLDFCFVALAPPRPRRRVRFLIRHDVYEHRAVGAVLHQLRQIPVEVHGDPTSGLAQAEDTLRRGEVVGVHPEGTINPSFVPGEGRTGAARLAQATGAPIVPVAVWGSQRLLTKWRPRQLTRHVPVLVRYGEPFRATPGEDPVAVTAELMRRIGVLLAEAQAVYPERPAPGEGWWLPAHLGGAAPTPEEVEVRLEQQAAERRRRARAEGEHDAA